VIAWNHLATALMEDFSVRSRRDRNLIRRAFLTGDVGHLYSASDGRRFARSSVNQLRATAARYPDDPEIRELIADLLAGSTAFAELWEAREIASEPTLCKSFHHPVVGLVTVNCDALAIPDCDQQVIIYTATPGSPSEEAVKLLSVVGTQRLDLPG
jgi:hypothetical protein